MICSETGVGQETLHDTTYGDLKMKEACVHWIPTRCSNIFCQMLAMHNQRHWRFLCKICHRQQILVPFSHIW